MYQTHVRNTERCLTLIALHPPKLFMRLHKNFLECCHSMSQLFLPLTIPSSKSLTWDVKSSSSHHQLYSHFPGVLAVSICCLGKEAELCQKGELLKLMNCWHAHAKCTSAQTKPQWSQCNNSCKLQSQTFRISGNPPLPSCLLSKV